MKTLQAQEVYKLRQRIVEPAIGDIKENHGLRAFLARGILGAKIEFNLACAARNLKKIWLCFQKKESDGEKTACLIRPQSSFRLVYKFC